MGRGSGTRFRRPSSVLLVLAVLLASAGVALAVSSRPSAGGHYVGLTSQRLFVRVVVSVNDSEFQNGRIYFHLHGGCHAWRFLSLSATPPPAVPINAQGHFSFTGSFPATTSFRYVSKVMFRGQFSNDGQVMTGSAKYNASNGHVSCTSGLITFRATRH